MAALNYVAAVQDFRRTRRQAALQEVLARLTGRSNELLSYEEVLRQVGARSRADRGLQEIPLDAIVGSVGRYTDFTRTFLPRSDSMLERWARVKTVATGMGGWSPIEVYQLGDVYFVLDGNHRVSVAREMGLATISAYVTQIKTKVPVTPDVEPEELIIKARYADFLQHTELDQTRPEADLAVTEAGAYHVLEEHIRVHRYYMGLEQQREIPYKEAAAHWYDTVYRPVAALIREKGLLHDFPDRTEIDLYIWLAEHRAELEEALGWDVTPEKAAENLAAAYGSTTQRVLARVGEKVRGAVLPDEFEPGPPAGEWRVHQLSARHDERLFPHVLVAINGEEAGWQALEQALTVAQREEAQLRALHVVPAATDKMSEAVKALEERFYSRLAAPGVQGRFVVETGTVAQMLCDRARWNDLLVMSLRHPPGKQMLQRLSSGFRRVIQRCSRPVLAVPGVASPLQRALLAYDGSAKAEEALFVATYLAGRWHEMLNVDGPALVVVTVAADEEEAMRVSARARRYLEAHEVQAACVVRSGPADAAILTASDEYHCDYLIMGSYRARPLLEIMLGSTLNQVLRQSTKPLLICR